MTSGSAGRTSNSPLAAGDTLMRTKMNKIADFIELFRAMHPEFPPQTILAFLYVAGNEGCSMADVAKELRISPMAASRNAVTLVTKYNGRTGYGLIDIDVDPIDTRQRRLHLSTQGKKLAQKINDILE